MIALPRNTSAIMRPPAAVGGGKTDPHIQPGVSRSVIPFAPSATAESPFAAAPPRQPNSRRRLSIPAVAVVVGEDVPTARVIGETPLC